MSDATKTPSELEVLRRYEVEQASRMRGFCGRCGHRWTPRNPSTSTKRCPACLVRGHVEFSILKAKPAEPEE